ncbi:MAG: hypothetical protein KGZ25_16310, partial [Planctomycetes bacterium]|nr:hypothetical protein [Planctomycetota bacterium]
MGSLRSCSIFRCCLVVLFALILVSPVGCRSASAVTLVENGKPQAVLVIPDKPARDEQDAAKELCDHIRLMSGAELEILKTKAPMDLKGRV